MDEFNSVVRALLCLVDNNLLDDKELVCKLRLVYGKVEPVKPIITPIAYDVPELRDRHKADDNTNKARIEALRKQLHQK